MSAFKASSRVAFAVAGMVSAAFGQTADDPGEGLRIDLTGTPNVRVIKWWGKTGRTYFVQSNPTLNPNTWSYMPVVETGSNGIHTSNFSTTGQRMFVRLVYTDQLYSGSASLADFDGDGLTNVQEVASSGPRSNPLNSDTDNDGFSDSVEWGGNYSPTNASNNPDYNGGSFKLRTNGASVYARHTVSQPVQGVQSFTVWKTYSNVPGHQTQQPQSFPERPELPALPAVPGFSSVNFSGWGIFDLYSDNPVAYGSHYQTSYDVVDEAEYDYSWSQLRLEANYASTRPRVAWMRLNSTSGGQQYITAVLPAGSTQTADFQVQTQQVANATEEISLNAAGVGQLEIRRDLDEISGTSVENWLPMSAICLKALPGQWIHLKVHVSNVPVGVYFNNFEWTLPDKTFKDYTATQTNGTLTQMSAGDKQGVSCSFYFADSGTKNISVNFQINGVATTLNTTINVEKPIGGIEFTRAGVANLFPVDNAPVGFAKMILLPANLSHQGMEFDGTIPTPPGWPKGKVAWVQLVTPFRQAISTTGSTLPGHSKNGELCLDTSYPYAHPGQRQESDTDQTHPFTDSPESSLYPTFSSATVFDQFNLYIMFKPAGLQSNFVPVMRRDWSWSATANMNLETLSWVVTPTAPTVGAQYETTIHPVWTQNIKTPD